MAAHFALARVRREVFSNDLPIAAAVDQLCRQAGLLWRDRLLTPLVTLRLFVLQILHGNTSIAHLRQLCGVDFAQSSYCEARSHLDRVRRHWAIVFQGNALFSGTVFDNIALALDDVKHMDPPSIRACVEQAVKSVELDVDSVLSLNIDELSGGMAKRVAIARAIALDPMLIFYDEPTTGLDPRLTMEIQDLILAVHLRKTQSGAARTSVIITHDRDLLYRLQPRIVMLNEGRIFFDGSYDTLSHSDSPVILPYYETMPALHVAK